MKKLSLILILFSLTLVSCHDDNLNKGEKSSMKKANFVNPNNIEKNYDVIEIDGCEYIVYSEYGMGGYQGYGFMAHKGNCKNPIHNH